ncbi:MAG: hypothetical protein PF487_05000 [Bacteroidales bacterium]|jgi:acyl carrier protein|nr:hypothetical protein [Bacteroidales bacterium]
MENLIINIINKLGEDFTNSVLLEVDNNTVLFGQDGCLDSLTLVALISEIEANIFETYKKEIVIADERAMSQQFSPFRTVETLSNYVKQLIEE